MIRWSSSGVPLHHWSGVRARTRTSGRPRASPGSSGGASDGQAVDQQRRLSHSGRNALAALAADADALVEREVVADALDPGQHGRTIADQRRALDRLGDLAAANAIGLGAGEDELAAGDVDLPAAEALGVDAVLDPARPARPDRPLPPSMKVLVIRGIGAWAKLSRRPLPVGSMPISRALSRSCR